MYNPQEAQKDFYNTKIAILIILIAITTYVFSTVLGTGIKYVLLKHYGTETNAEVVNITSRRGEKLDFNSNNSWGLNNDVSVIVKFRTASEKETQSSVFVKKIRKKNAEGKRIEQMPFVIGEQVAIIYYAKDPNIILLRAEFPKFKTDYNIMLGSFLALMFLALVLFFQIKSYRKFRKKAQHY